MPQFDVHRNSPAYPAIDSDRKSPKSRNTAMR
jgi:hypothetical protein